MPIPKPHDGESKDDFMDRCMGDDTMVSEYPADQRAAVCNDAWGKSMAKTYELDVEIFAVGQWNGMDFGIEDLNMMASAFSSLKDYHRVPLKFGHNDEQPMTDGQPALGWMDNVWVEGNKLMAHFSDMPELVYNAMKAKLYRNVSIELDMGVEHKGNYYTWVLSGVALLGADIPAVNTLSDLQAYMGRDELSFTKRMVFTAVRNDDVNDRSKDMPDENIAQELATLKAKFAALEKEHDKLVTENMDLKKERTEMRAKFTSLEADDKDRKTKEQRKSLEDRLEVMVQEKKITPFSRDDFLADFDEQDDKATVIFAVDKMEKTIAANPAYFGAEQARKKAAAEQEDEGKPADKLVVQRTREYMAEHGEKNFSVAKTAVLRADPKLAESYTKGA